jgi:ABC-2 type transport system permease protein
MRNAFTIAQRDFKSYFKSPIAYIIIAAFLVIMGITFFLSMSQFNMRNMQFQQFNMGKSLSITDGIIRPVFGQMNVILLILLPFVTMRLFAEEKKMHTIELLLTAPVTLAEIVLGKFLASFYLLAIMLGCTLVYPIVLFIFGNPDPGPVFTNYLGLLLVGSGYLAVGVFASSVTENQIVAGALTFGTLFVLWLLSWVAQFVGPELSGFFNGISIIGHWHNFFQGVIVWADVFYYFSLVFIALYLTHAVLDSYRWR